MTVAASTSTALIEQLRATWSSIDVLCQELSAEEWALPTACPGWTVSDQLAHVIGIESLLAGRPTPPAPKAPVAGGASYVRNEVGAVNEQWIAALRGLHPEDLLAEFRLITAERLESLAVRGPDEWDEPSWTPIGQAPYRRFMQIRVFDCWVHEQDIRRAVGRPGHGTGAAADQSLDEIERSLGFVIGKKAGAGDGSRVTFELVGPAHRSIHVAVAGRAAVVAVLDGSPDVTLRLGSDQFVALACGRIDPRSSVVAVEGDQALGQRIVENLAFTI